ncbi:MAG: hypothetical protein J5762_01570 [Clostridia bacterium]|nr:hypothetical protein [Clostridia bacterium]
MFSNNIDDDNVAPLNDEVKSDKDPVSVKCDNCGSSDIAIISDEFGVCRHCRTIISFPKDNITNVINSTVNIYSAEAHPNVNDYNGVYMVDKTIGDNAFLRECFIYLAEKDTPNDIFETTEFGIVKNDFNQLAMGQYDINISYSCSIGIDKTEHYKETVLKNGKLIEIDKTRTVTQWTPQSGNYYSQQIATVQLDNDENNSYFLKKVDSYRFTLEYNNINNNNSVKDYDKNAGYPAPLPLTEKTEAELIDCAVSKASEDCKKSLTGFDRHIDNFSISSNNKCLKIARYVVPSHSMKFKYKGKTHECRAFSAGLGLISLGENEMQSAKVNVYNRVIDQVSGLSKAATTIPILTILMRSIIAVV